MNENFDDCYRTLGVMPGCSWSELRIAYRHLVRRWHPDRHDSRPEGLDHFKNGEKIKEITSAYRKLAQFRRKYGHLPPAFEADAAPFESTTAEDPAATTPPANDSPVTPPRHFHASHRNPVRAHPVRYIAWGVAAAIVYAGYNAMRNENEESDAKPANAISTIATTIPATESIADGALESERFTIGASVGEVYEIQGMPTRSEPGLWHYGMSKVYFSHGVVTRWDEDPASPLKAALPSATAEIKKNVFSLGSSKADVRAIQGPPIIESASVWDYGLSKIYFRDNYVVGWEDSPMRPLRLRH